MHHRPFAVLALPIMFAIVACGAGAGSRFADPATSISALTEQADRWDQAIVRKDRPAIAANMCDDFRQIRAGGGVANRDQFLEFITSEALTIDPYTVEDLDVRVYGGTALLSGTTRMSGSPAGARFTSHYRYVDVYLKHDDRWCVSNVQITTMAE